MCFFYLDINNKMLLDLRAHKYFWNDLQIKKSEYTLYVLHHSLVK